MPIFCVYVPFTRSLAFLATWAATCCWEPAAIWLSQPHGLPPATTAQAAALVPQPSLSWDWLLLLGTLLLGTRESLCGSSSPPGTRSIFKDHQYLKRNCILNVIKIDSEYMARFLLQKGVDIFFKITLDKVQSIIPLKVILTCDCLNSY